MYKRPGSLGSSATARVIAGGRRADGTAWPVPVTLSVPKELTEHERLVLQDPEGVPLAVLEVSEAWQDPTTQGFRLAGPLKALRAPAHGPFHRLRRRPDELRPREGSPGNLAAPSEPLLAVATRDFLHRKQLGQIRQVAEQLGAKVLVLPLLGGEHDDSLVRAMLAVRRDLPDGTEIVPVPLPPRGGDEERDVLLRAHVAAAYGATHLLGDRDTEGTPIPVVVPEPWAYDADVEVWRPVARIEPDHVKASCATPGSPSPTGSPRPPSPPSWRWRGRRSCRAASPCSSRACPGPGSPRSRGASPTPWSSAAAGR